MSKFTRKLSVVFLATVMALSLVACQPKEEAEPKEAAVQEEKADKAEVTKEGSLIKVEPQDDGSAEMTFKAEDGKEETVILKDKRQLYNFTILHKYSYSYNSKKEIIDFNLLEAYEAEEK